MAGHLAFLRVPRAKIESCIKFLKGAIAHLEHAPIDHAHLLEQARSGVSHIGDVQSVTSGLLGQVCISLSEFVLGGDILIGDRYFGALTLIEQMWHFGKPLQKHQTV